MAPFALIVTVGYYATCTVTHAHITEERIGRGVNTELLRRVRKTQQFLSI